MQRSARPLSRSNLLQKFDCCRTIFMCCDIQEKLRHRIPNFQAAVEVSNAMASIHTIMTPTHSTFVATEQYPVGVGRLVQDIKLPAGAPVIEKVQPSMLVPEMMPYINGDAERGILPVGQAVLWGHETHVCVLQTADDLLSRGIRVAVLVDGCASQQSLDHDVAVREMATWNHLMLTTAASALMQLSRGDPAVMKKAMKMLRASSVNLSCLVNLPARGGEAEAEKSAGKNFQK
ncbi:hypothetical protein LSCM1_07172 [Leishmania martiniquensis]|uniref:Isochorismatase-like domain-containing protein n=1 Tax=Leishmania martiniquensis TaxID=1580590 RepID=A0A836H2M4_9TRYP|nr:hypothetical protein LSCM1_07172 [Leishmania martiniquensis]